MGRHRRCGVLWGMTSLLSLGGCLADWEAGLDAIAAPDALSNAQQLPYNGLAGLAEAFLRLF